MRIAVSADNNEGLNSIVSPHFGRCPHFVLVDVEGQEIREVQSVDNPYYGNHQPGQVPGFIASHGANVMLTGGMGGRAIMFFQQYGIEGVTYSREGDDFTILPEYEDLEKMRQIGAWDVYEAMGYIAQRANWHQLWDAETVANMTNTAWSAWAKQIYFVTPTGEQVQYQIEEKRKEIFQQIVGGTYSVDEGWDRWLAEFERLDGGIWEAEMKAEYEARK